MPLPKPRKNEEKNAFVSRFMEAAKNESNMTQKQKLAAAYAAWRNKGK